MYRVIFKFGLLGLLAWCLLVNPAIAARGGSTSRSGSFSRPSAPPAPRISTPSAPRIPSPARPPQTSPPAPARSPRPRAVTPSTPKVSPIPFQQRQEQRSSSPSPRVQSTPPPASVIVVPMPQQPAPVIVVPQDNTPVYAPSVPLWRSQPAQAQPTSGNQESIGWTMFWIFLVILPIGVLAWWLFFWKPQDEQQPNPKKASTSPKKVQIETFVVVLVGDRPSTFRQEALQINQDFGIFQDQKQVNEMALLILRNRDSITHAFHQAVPSILEDGDKTFDKTLVWQRSRLAGEEFINGKSTGFVDQNSHKIPGRYFVVVFIVGTESNVPFMMQPQNAEDAAKNLNWLAASSFAVSAMIVTPTVGEPLTEEDFISAYPEMRAIG